MSSCTSCAMIRLVLCVAMSAPEIFADSLFLCCERVRSVLFAFCLFAFLRVCRVSFMQLLRFRRLNGGIFPSFVRGA